MKYSIASVAASLPKEKNSADSYWTRWVLRPLSFPVAALALNLGLTPNSVSWISAVCAVIGGGFLGAGMYLSHGYGSVFQWTGIGLLFVFSVLDCADGNMARTLKKPNVYGSWTDAVGGYIAYTAALLGLGLATEYAAGGAGGGYAALGGVAAALNMLMRASVQSHRLTQIKVFGKTPPDPSDPGGEKRLSENLGVTGIFIPAIAAGFAAGQLFWVLCFYTLLYGFGSLWVVFKLAWGNMKESKAQNI